jgi:hypothetical protein
MMNSIFNGYIDNVINANNAQIKKRKITTFPNERKKLSYSNAITYVYWQVQNLSICV